MRYIQMDITGATVSTRPEKRNGDTVTQEPHSSRRHAGRAPSGLLKAVTAALPVLEARGVSDIRGTARHGAPGRAIRAARRLHSGPYGLRLLNGTAKEALDD